MPKIISKGLSAQRVNKVYNIRRCTSEPSLQSKSDGYLNLLKDYTNLLRDHENQIAVKRIIDKQLDILKNELNCLKEEIQNSQKVHCQVCFSDVCNINAIHMGDCGHGACRPCFVQSVVYTAIHLRQHNDVDTIQESWRCFSCREYNYSFIQYQRGVSIVKYVSCRSELRDTVLRNYRKLEKSLKLPPLHQNFQENELWQEADENNTVAQSVMSLDTQPNEGSRTYNNLRIIESHEAVGNVRMLVRSQVPGDVGVHTAEDLEMVGNGQGYENVTNLEDSILLQERNVTEVAQLTNESNI